jgi:DNA-binding response OmpR family regulator
MAKKILIIDDEIEICELVKIYLENLGEFSVQTAHNGREGLHKAMHAKPDLVLLDINMPLMNGYKVLESLKANEDTCHIPVIMLTGACNNETVVSISKQYGDGYLAKPFDIEALKDAVLSRTQMHPNELRRK